jgi:hypothetical protein
LLPPPHIQKNLDPTHGPFNSSVFPDLQPTGGRAESRGGGRERTDEQSLLECSIPIKEVSKVGIGVQRQAFFDPCLLCS